MPRTHFDNINCGVAQAVEQLGDGWTLLIVRDAIFGATRFQQFESNLGIAKNILSDRLAKLVQHGVFDKSRLDEPGNRFSYELTSKGRDLWIVITALRLWGDKWVLGDENVPVKFADRKTGKAVAGLIAVDAEGVPVEAGNLEWTRGPGWPERENVASALPWASPPLSKPKPRVEPKPKPTGRR
jgi:DNA-binding HxlR family transcriptional regulator